MDMIESMNNGPGEYAQYLLNWRVLTDDQRSLRHLCIAVQEALKDYAIAEGDLVQILDVCAGTGFCGKSVASAVAGLGLQPNVTFTDRDSRVASCVEIANNKEHIVIDDAVTLSKFSDKTFDLVCSRYGFNNLSKDEWESALNAVLRVLRPGGTFILQDHFIPGKTFCSMVNEAEQFLAALEGKAVQPYIFSTEDLNELLDAHDDVESRIKTGYPLQINIFERLEAKARANPLFDAQETMKKLNDFYRKVCLEKYQVQIVDPESYIPVYNVTYRIKKRG